VREPTPHVKGAAGTADVDDAETVDLEQKKVPDCAIAANFVDVGTLTIELRGARVSEPGYVERGQAGCSERLRNWEIRLDPAWSPGVTVLAPVTYQ
jgi:hypothetical protein